MPIRNEKRCNSASVHYSGVPSLRRHWRIQPSVLGEANLAK